MFEETVRENQEPEGLFPGLMFMVVGIAFAWGATTYTVGEGARMGPGYFPLMLGILLALIGLFVILRRPGGGDRGRREDRQVGLEAAVLHHRANLVFGILLGGLPKLGIPAMGLIVAIYALTFIASAGGQRVQGQGSRRSSPPCWPSAATSPSSCC
jgi:hypothetical protein